MRVKIQRVNDRDLWDASNDKWNNWSVYVICNSGQEGQIMAMLDEKGLGEFDMCPNFEGDNDELMGDHISIKRFETHDTKAQWERDLRGEIRKL